MSKTRWRICLKFIYFRWDLWNNLLALTLSFSSHIQFLSNFNITQSIYELFLPFLQADVGSLCHTLHQPKPTFPSQEFRVVHPRQGSVVTLSSVFNPFCPGGEQPYADPRYELTEALPACNTLFGHTYSHSTASAGAFMPREGITVWLINGKNIGKASRWVIEGGSQFLMMQLEMFYLKSSASIVLEELLSF